MKRRLKIKSKRSGFLVLEALVAMSVLLIVLPAALSLGFSTQALQAAASKKLAEVAGSADMIANGVSDFMASSSGQYVHEFGRSTCSIALQTPDISHTQVYINDPSRGGIDFGANASGTSVTARDGYIYETVDPSASTAPDFFVVNATVPASPVLVSSINAGPGLAGVSVAGHYAYLADESSIYQLEVVDLSNRTKPAFVVGLKVPLPTSTTTAPHGSAIFYENGTIFLGTQKWTGNEFNVIDATESASPRVIGGFDTDTVVNAMYADSYDPSGHVYVADADTDQMRVLDVLDPSNIALVSGFSSAGSSVLEGKSFDATYDYEENTGDNMLYFGRAGGGFDNPAYSKIFAFDLSRDPLAADPIYAVDIPGGVYDIVSVPGYIFMAVGNDTVELWKADLSALIYSITLPVRPVSIMCDHDRLYVGLAGRQGFAVIIPNST